MCTGKNRSESYILSKIVCKINGTHTFMLGTLYRCKALYCSCLCLQTESILPGTNLAGWM